MLYDWRRPHKASTLNFDVIISDLLCPFFFSIMRAFVHFDRRFQRKLFRVAQFASRCSCENQIRGESLLGRCHNQQQIEVDETLTDCSFILSMYHHFSPKIVHYLVFVFVIVLNSKSIRHFPMLAALTLMNNISVLFNRIY